MLTSHELLEQLALRGIAYERYEHEAVANARAAERVKALMRGLVCKTLFVGDKHGALWLYTLPLDFRADLGALARELGTSRLSFADEQRMIALLGVRPGSVTPLAVINDEAGRVRLALDSSLLNENLINVHPLINTMSIDLRPKDLITFARESGHEPHFVRAAIPPALPASEESS